MPALITSKRSFYGNSVKALHNETAAAPVEISDGEADQTLHSHVKESTINSLFPPSSRSRNSQLPAKPLGGLVREKHDPQPVFIPNPEDVPRRSYMTLQTINTLNGPQAFSRPSYPIQRITRSTPRSRKGQHPAPTDARDNNHSASNKKQRTGPSPKDGIKDSSVDVSLHASIEAVDQRTRKQTSRLLQRGLDLESVESTPGKQAYQPIVILDSQPQDNSLGADRDYTQVAYNNSQIRVLQTALDADSDETKAVHSTGLQGCLEQQSSPPPMRQPIVSPASATVSTAQDPPDQASTEQGGLSLDESPDPLQKSATAQQSRKKPTQIPVSPKLSITSAETHRPKATNKRLSNAPSRKSGAVSSSFLEQARISAFAIKDIAGFHVHRKQDYYLLYVDHIEQTFWISISTPTIDTDPISRRRPLGKIIKIFYGAESSKIHVKLSSSHDDEFANDFVVELESHKKVLELLNVIGRISPVSFKPLEDAKLDGVFHQKIKLEQDAKQASYFHKLSGDNSPSYNQVDSVHLASKKGRKLDYEKLPDDSDPSESRVSRGTDNIPSICKTPSRDLQTELEYIHTGDRPHKTRKPASGLVSEHFAPRSTRSTRSTTQPKSESIRTPSPVVPFSERVGLGVPWSNPLAYPKESKKREIIEYCDLLRLDEDQFLNDSLISFFIRYLQHQLELSNPDLLKKMHFFNTYFFDTLTKNSKGRKDVNHTGVARWTKNIDIFSRDFIVVPVNDNLHWYLAIICNLPAFIKRRRHNEDDEEDDNIDSVATTIEILEDDQLPENSEDRDSGQLQRIQQTRQSFQELTLQDTPQDILQHPQTVMSPAGIAPKGSSQTEARASPAKTKAGRGKKSKIRKSLPKYDLEIPIIITLDSLGQSRGPAVSALKQYVVLEAKDKKDLDIDREELKGMTAKGIPSQSNYSDCGLYMCMYLEQFVADPYGFVKKILQREDADLRWPHKIQSNELRSRLRQLVLQLHHQQEGHKSERDIPPLGGIMVELRNPSPDFIASTPPIQSDKLIKTNPQTASEGTRKYLGVSKPLESVDTEPQTKQPQLDEQGDRVTKQDIRPTSLSSQKRTMDEVEEARRLVDHVPSNMHSPIVVDDSPERPPKRPRPLPGLASLRRPFKTQDRVHLRWDDNDDPIVDERHSTSLDRAQQTSHKPSYLARRGLRSSHSSKDMQASDRPFPREATLSGNVNLVDESPGDVNHEQDGVVTDSADALDVEVTEIQEEISARCTSIPAQSRRSQRLQNEGSEDFEELV